MTSDVPSPTSAQPPASTTNTTMLTSSSSSPSETPNGSISHSTQPAAVKGARIVDTISDAEQVSGTNSQTTSPPPEPAEDGTEHLPIPPNPIPLSQVCADVYSRIERFLATKTDDEVTTSTQRQVQESMGIVEQALDKYGFEHLSLSYNGGKDCLVLLLVYLAVLHTHFTRPEARRKDESSTSNAAASEAATSKQPFPTSIPSIYATPPDPFPAVTSFVALSSSAYHLDLVHIRTNPPPPTAAQQESGQPHPHLPHLPVRTFRDAFALYLKQHESTRAIFVGTRRTDPHGATLTPFQHTDGNWPSFMRVHPVLDWKLSEIWCFLRWGLSDSEGAAGVEREALTGKVGYCAMYDEGYTSLGGRGDTMRNPLLKSDGEEGGYRPAYTMVEDREERAGRE